MFIIRSNEEVKIINKVNFICPKCKSNSNSCELSEISLNLKLGYFIPIGSTKRLEIKCQNCEQVFPLKLTIENFHLAKDKPLDQFIGKAEGSLDYLLFFFLAIATLFPIFGIISSLLGCYLTRFSETWLKKGYFVLIIISVINTFVSLALPFFLRK
jgi:hypothetical protein